MNTAPHISTYTISYNNKKKKSVAFNLNKLVISFFITALVFNQFFLPVETVVAADYIPVSSCQDLQDINQDLTANYVLQNDIDCSGFDFTPITTEDGDPFTGVLDGNNFKIDNLSIIDPEGFSALFVRTNGAEIKNLKISNLEIESLACSASLVVLAFENLIIDNVNVNGSLVDFSTSECASGGLVGYYGSSDESGNLTINRSSFIGTISSQITAGLIGIAVSGEVVIENSYTQGSITAENASGVLLAGLFSSIIINNSYSSMDLYVPGTESAYVPDLLNAGMVAVATDLDISNSFYSGHIYMSEEDGVAGGITAYPVNSSGFTTLVDNVYYFLPEESDLPCIYYAPDADADVVDCPSVASQDYFKGLDVQSRNPFSAWDFEDVWTAKAGDFPILKSLTAPEPNPSTPRRSGSVIRKPEQDIVVPSGLSYEELKNSFTNSNGNLPQNNFRFTRNLGLGSNSSDVKYLQEFLNKNNFMVSDSGAGSVGKETNYFGIKTYNAVRKFQEAYPQHILTPLNLIRGTGFFGDKTREFVNTLF